MFLVPDDAADFYIKAFIGSAFVLKFIDLVQLIVSQCTVDIFLVDWERKPNEEGATSPRHETSNAGSATGDRVSAWRRIMVANEWAELQVRWHMFP